MKAFNVSQLSAVLRELGRDWYVEHEEREKDAVTESSILSHKHSVHTAKHHLLNTGLAMVQIINGACLALIWRRKSL